MRRWASNILAGLLLGLCVATLALWWRSSRGDFGEFLGLFDVRTTDQLVVMQQSGIYSSHGCLGIGVTHSEYAPSHPQFADFVRSYPPGLRTAWGSDHCFERVPFSTLVMSSLPYSWWNKLGFCARDWQYSNWTRMIRSSGVAVPHWLIAGLTAILPLARARWYWRRYRRQKTGLCMECGYDLRASPERCPECGTAVPAKVEGVKP